MVYSWWVPSLKYLLYFTATLALLRILPMTWTAWELYGCWYSTASARMVPGLKFWPRA